MRFLAALLACFCLELPAATPTTDFSDLWFNPAEEGWGVTITQQNQFLFVTLFVYEPNGQPKWYVGPATAYLGANASGLAFSGPLYSVTGPYFGAATFDESLVVAVPVGTVTFTASQINSAALTYTVGPVPVTKAIQRQTWKYENITGAYLGGSVGMVAGCGDADGYFESLAYLTVSHDGAAAVTLREDGNGYTCNYSGTYVQEGRMGTITGTGSCSDGTTPSFVATEVQGGIQALSLRYRATFSANCTAAGRMGGVRRGD